MSTTHAPEQELHALHRRHAELSAQLVSLDQQREREREALGRAIAAGKDGAAHQNKARDLSEEAEGLRRALPILEGDMDALRTRIAQERLSTAEAASRETTEQARASIAQVDEALRVFVAGDLAKLRTRMVAALEADRKAVDEYEKVADEMGHAVAPHRPNVWGQHQALPLLLAVLDRYLKTGAVLVDPRAVTRSEPAAERSLALT